MGKKFIIIRRGAKAKSFILPLCIGIIFGSGFTFLILNLLSNFEDSKDNVEWTLFNYLIEHDKDIQNANQQIEIETEKETVRVLCWIMTGPANHNTKAIHVKNTWGKRCNTLLFMSSAEDLSFEGTLVALPNVQEGREFLWEKTRQAFNYVYEHHYEDADWFFKADDDTYAIMENLRYFLQDKNPEDPVYFGTRLKQHVTQGYMSGGAGYVLSKEALRRFVEIGLTNSTLCPPSTADETDEDVEMGKCLEILGVEAGDTRDRFGRNRFLPLTPENHIIPSKRHNPQQWWYNRSTYYLQEQGPKCCSDEGITFHYMPPAQMYVMEYLIYQLKPNSFSQIRPSLTANSEKIET
jgi:glycoprotein-N-acetylgalactosamine 3-beta-galactosyltransferase